MVNLQILDIQRLPCSDDGSAYPSMVDYKSLYDISGAPVCVSDLAPSEPW
jgi:hypothetical protein